MTNEMLEAKLDVKMVPNQNRAFQCDPVSFIEVNYKGHMWMVPVMEFTVQPTLDGMRVGNVPQRCFGVQFPDKQIYGRTPEALMPAFLEYYQAYIVQKENTQNSITLDDYMKGGV